MKFILYGYEGRLYAVPETDAEEVRACDELIADYGGRFARVGELELFREPNTEPKRKWIGYELYSETPFLKLVKKTARNADFL